MSSPLKMKCKKRDPTSQKGSPSKEAGHQLSFGQYRPGTGISQSLSSAKACNAAIGAHLQE
jgi:hypothetical protein